MAREQEDEILHSRSRHCLKLLNDNHQGGLGSFAVFSGIPAMMLIKESQRAIAIGRALKKHAKCTHQAARVEMLASDLFTPSSSSSEVRSDTT